MCQRGLKASELNSKLRQFLNYKHEIFTLVNYVFSPLRKKKKKNTFSYDIVLLLQILTGLFQFSLVHTNYLYTYHIH
jgi:hypothetical protein